MKTRDGNVAHINLKGWNFKLTIPSNMLTKYWNIDWCFMIVFLVTMFQCIINDFQTFADEECQFADLE